MAFTENIEIINISNLTQITDVSIDDVIIINDTSDEVTKIIELQPFTQFMNRELTLAGLKDVALEGGVGRDLAPGHGLVYNGVYWVNEPVVNEAPIDGASYMRNNGGWVKSTVDGVQAVKALAGLENIGDEQYIKLQVDQNWFDSKYAPRGDSVSFVDLNAVNSISLDEKGRLEYNGNGTFTFFPPDLSDFFTAETLPPETDPMFMASAASSIRFQDTINWNTAYSWGDHSQQNYLKEGEIELNSLNDVFVANMEDGHVLKWSANSGSWFNGRPSPGKLKDLEDVSVAGSQTGWAILYDAGSDTWPSQPLLLEKLTDVEVNSVAPGDFLAWDGDNWINKEESTTSVTAGPGIIVYPMGPDSVEVALNATIGQINNVSTSADAAVQGDVLTYVGNQWMPATGGSNATINITAGTNMSGGGSFSLNQSTNKTITLQADVGEAPDDGRSYVRQSKSWTVASGGGGGGLAGVEQIVAGRNIDIQPNSGRGVVTIHAADSDGNVGVNKIIAGDGIKVTPSIGQGNVTITALTGGDKPTLQLVTDNGNTADNQIFVKGLYLENPNDQATLAFRNTIGTNGTDFDFKVRQNARNLQIQSNTVVGVKELVSFEPPGVASGFSERVSVPDPSFNTKSVRENVGRLIIGGDNYHSGGCDTFFQGELFLGDDSNFPIMGPRVWGKIQVKDADNNNAIRVRTKAGSRQRSGQYNFDADFGGDGLIIVNFRPQLPTSEYCVIVSSDDGGYDHFNGYEITDRPNSRLLLYTRDAGSIDDNDDSLGTHDNPRNISFMVMF